MGDTFMISLTADQAVRIAEFIEDNFSDFVAEYENWNDDIDYMCDICEVYKKFDVIRKGLELTT